MKTVTMALPYTDEDLKDIVEACPRCQRALDERTLSPGERTLSLIRFAVRMHKEYREGLEGQLAKKWARIQKLLRAAGEGRASLNQDQFDFVYKAVDQCRWPANGAEAVAVLLEHLEEVKLQKAEEDGKGPAERGAEAAPASAAS